MRANFKSSLSAVLIHEGGYSNHPKDPGGATMRGVTQRVYDAHRRNMGRELQSVRNISEAEIEAIYYQQYWMAVRADNLPSGLDYAVFDYAVNSGPRRAIEHLQEVLGVTVDGLMGNVTIAAAASKPAEGVITKLCDRRMKFLKGLSTWSTFGKGWTSRVDGVRAKALSMASVNPSQPDVAPTVPPLPGPPPEPVSTKRSIGEVMLWVVGAILAGIAAVFFGGK